MSWRSLPSFFFFKDTTMGERTIVYTIKSYGMKLARKHLIDWLTLLLLLVIEVILNVIKPFYSFVGKEMMEDLKYPLKPNTIPFWVVPMYTILLPIIIFSIRYLKRRDVHDLHHATLGLLYAVLITAVITDVIKDAVGSPRPDFFWRCFPNGQDNYDSFGNVICHGDPSVVKEGYKSFPSGHSSWSFAGFGYLSLYMAGKIKLFDKRGHVAKLCPIILPFLVATLVAISRVDDYWHHWRDVYTGALIGVIISFICYILSFPPPYRTKGWEPYSYFAALEEDSQVTKDTHVNDLHITTTERSESHLLFKHGLKDHNITIND